MCDPVQSIVDAIVGKIVETVFKPVGPHVGFLFHYKRNLKNLEDEMSKLQGQRTNVEGKVDQAKHRGEAIDDNISVWLKDVDETRQGVDTFMYEKTIKENMRCFNFSCPNFISRYRLNKQAEKMVTRIRDLTEKGREIGIVSHPRAAPPELELPSSRDYEDFNSRDKVFKGIVEALKDPEVNMIGVYGTGGVGKTTMVEKVGKLLKEDGTFDEVVIAVVSKDAIVREIQGQLADRLNVTLSGETEVGRANGLWNRLDNGKKNLILLDDVWQELDLNKIGIPTTGGNKSCKVVLTSRNRDVLKNMDIHKDFEIEFLCEEEAWTLFKKKVGNYVNSYDQPLLRNVAWTVCKECQGLPIAINALGAALKDKDTYVWEDALDKLKNSMLKDIEGINSKVYASLKLSYDRLDSEDAKSCFLLCCLFPEDANIPIDSLVRYYMAWRTLHRDQKPDTLEKALYRVRTVVGTLTSCCLLLHINSDDVVKMHDVVRDVAISIAKDEKSFLVKHGVKDWPEKASYGHCSAISLRMDDMREFPDKLVCPELHTLRLDCTFNKFPLQVPDKFLNGAENLMILDFLGVTMFPLIPDSFAKLAKLQMLCLIRCKLGDIAILKDLKDHLEILSLRGSTIEQLPLEVGELTRLRLLDMKNCDKLEMIPKGVMSKLVRLEELYMPTSFHQWEGTRAEMEISSVSLHELMSLTRLTSLDICIQDPTLLPKDDFFFENLVRFRITVGGESIYHDEFTIKLFNNHDFNPSGILRLKNVHLANACEYLLGKCKWSIERNGLYPSTSFNHLGDLSVTDCSKLEYLFSPSSARGLVRLQKLKIARCTAMEGVIRTEGDKDEDIVINFSVLNSLSLTYLENLISFYPKKKMTATNSGCSYARAQTVLFNDKVAFPALEELEISVLPNITDIWDKKLHLAPGPLCPLRKLAVTFCPMVEVIVDLEKKKVETQEAANNTIVPFPELRDMTLQGLQKIKGFCAFRLEEQRIFNAQVAFPKLEKLVVDTFGETALRQLTDASDLSLKYLMFSRISSEVSTVVFPHLFRRLWFVDLLDVTSCRGAREVFRFDGLEVGEGQVCVGQLTQVRKVYLDDLPQLTCLWNKDPHRLLSLQSLEYLTIKNCPLLANLFTASVAKALGGLKVLYLRSCSTMEEVIATDEKGHKDVLDDDDDEIEFPKLEWLILKDLSNLKSFCTSNHNFNFPSLKRVILKRCPKVQAFTFGSVRMPQILLSTRRNECLTIEDLNKHLEQQHLKGEETIRADEWFADEDKFSFLDRF